MSETNIGVEMEITSEITGAIAVGQLEPGLQVPVNLIFLAEPPEHTEDKSLQACRACLLTDCRLYSMEKCNLKEMFKQLTGLQLLDDKYQSSLCAVCATFLVKCKRFRERSLTAQKMLNMLSNTTRTVTIGQIKKVDRNTKKLSSNLSVTQSIPNFYNTEIYEDYVGESPANLNCEQIYTQSTRDCWDNCIKLSCISLVKQSPPSNFDTEIDVYENDEEKEEIPISVKSKKIRTALVGSSEANLAKREYIKLSSNSSVKQNPPDNIDTDVYQDDIEEIPIDINGKQIKTELTSDYKEEIAKRESELSVKENPPYVSYSPYITYTYENYEENTLTTLKNELLPIEMLSDSDENDNDKIKTESNHEQVGVNIMPIDMVSDSDENDNDKIKTETNHEQAEVNVSKEINEREQKVQLKKAVDECKPATETAKETAKIYFNCEQCKKVLKSKSFYLAHLRLKHHSKQHVCCLCGLSFINSRILKVHQSRSHWIDNSHIPDDRPRCPVCSLHFLTKEALQIHLHGTLKDTRVSAKHYSEFGEDLNAEASDSPENEEYLKSESDNDEEGKDDKEKDSTKRINKSDSPRKLKSGKVPLDQKKMILRNIIVVKRLTLEEQLEVIQKRIENNENKPYKCDICCFGTNLKKILETHMVRHSEEMGQFSCDLCHFRFKTRKAFGAHKLRHSYMYSCIECPFTTYIRDMATKHAVRFHERQKYTCGKCGKVYKNSDSYYQHKKMKHPSSEHVCCLCGYSFVSTTGLLTHHKAKHLQESIEIPKLTEGPSCAECSLRFVNEKALQKHMGVSHATETDKKILNSASDSKDVYKRYEKTKVVCETCGKLVPIYRMKTHLEEHAGKTFPCPICGKIYATKSGMSQHKFVKHSKRNKYKPNKVKTKRSQCKDCGKIYSSSANLKKHMQRAHSDDTLLCNYCAKKFSHAENLKSHVDHVHLKKPWYRNRAR